ncbi:MAG: hypothetical protein PWQ39_1470, partial [Thermacetogenium sp.]|nr:hypothetical protein [Thermacetogenium sp.]
LTGKRWLAVVVAVVVVGEKRSNFQIIIGEVV